MATTNPTGKLLCPWLVVLVACCLSGTALAHPFHTSVAELEYNPQTKRVEVSLKLPAVDLERALSMLAMRQINLEKDSLSELVTQYLDLHFLIVDSSLLPATSHSQLLPNAWPARQRSQTHFVGHELKATWSWLYFEMELPQSVDKLCLIDTILFDLNTGQINTVSVRRGGQRTAMKMIEKEAWSPLDADWLQAPVETAPKR